MTKPVHCVSLWLLFLDFFKEFSPSVNSLEQEHWLWMSGKILGKFLSVYSLRILRDLSPQFRVKDDATQYSQAIQM